MLEATTYRKAIMLAASAVTLLALAGTAQAAKMNERYWQSGSGGAVVNPYGECWQGAGGTTPPGCEDAPMDADGDGVVDADDQCPDTPAGVAVDSVGCPLDSDGDGVADYMDKCPGTPAGIKVDGRGCPLDSDGDGVTDAKDQCPGTPKGVQVDAVGCEAKMVLTSINFDFDKATLKPSAKGVLNGIADRLKKSGVKSVTVVGHTDSIGSEQYNMNLSERRAVNAMYYLIEQGVASEKLKAKGMGESMPIATNDTREGRAKNRRVEFNVER